jgi:hypothetical protein
MSAAAPKTVSDKYAIRPFRVDVPDAELTELRRRIKATRFPERETVPDQTQGPQLATLQKLTSYWATEYDWRRVEARLNALPNFVTEIDGLDIHFIHVRSKHDNGLPLIVTHGWPGSVIEQLKIVEPLTNPTAHGASAGDALLAVQRRPYVAGPVDDHPQQPADQYVCSCDDRRIGCVDERSRGGPVRQGDRVPVGESRVLHLASRRRQGR